MIILELLTFIALNVLIVVKAESDELNAKNDALIMNPPPPAGGSDSSSSAPIIPKKEKEEGERELESSKLSSNANNEKEVKLTMMTKHLLQSNFLFLSFTYS